MDDNQAPVKRGRGRPKGSGGNLRPDSTVQTDPGDNTKYIAHNLRMWNWGPPNMKDPEDVNRRIEEYFRICGEDDMKPSVAGMAMAFGWNRRELWEYTHGQRKAPPETVDVLKKAYIFLNAQMENYMQNGKINPVAGIFLLKNNMGYTDKQEVVLTPNDPLGEAKTAQELEEAYIEAAGLVEDVER